MRSRSSGMAALAVGLHLATAAGGAVVGAAAVAPETAAACFAQVRDTDDGKRLEAFLRDVQRELGPAAALVGDESALLRRLVESTDPAARAANHERLHWVLGARLDDATHGAIHSLAGAMLACLEGAPS